MSSLRLKIFLALGLLVVTAIALLGVLSRGVTRTGLHQIVELEEARGQEADLALAKTLRRDLEEAWWRDGDFRAAEGILDDFARTTAGLPQVPGIALFDARARLVVGRDMPSDRVEAKPLGGTEEGMIKAQWTIANGGRNEVLELRGGLPVRDREGTQIGTLLPILRSSPERAADRREALSQVDRRLLAAAGGVAALALLLGGLLVRRIVRPIEALSEAARALGAGDLGRRVRVRSDDELGRLGRAFNQMAGALERAEGLRRQMVADVAHELRTPLAALRAQLEAIQDGLVAATPETVASLVEDTDHLGRLVDDLQDLALADAGRLTLDRQPLSLKDEVLAAARSLGFDSGHEPGPEPDLDGGLEPGLDRGRLSADGPGLSPRSDRRPGLVIDLPPGLPRVDFDPRRLRQVLLNLLENARVHGASGSSARSIVVSARVEGHDHPMIRLSVRDHGPGIAKDDLPRVAERFSRGDPSRGRTCGGTGLGLAIAKSLVELHGGTLEADNAEGGGAVIAVTLPVASRGSVARSRPAAET